VAGQIAQVLDPGAVDKLLRAPNLAPEAEAEAEPRPEGSPRPAAYQQLAAGMLLSALAERLDARGAGRAGGGGGGPGGALRRLVERELLEPAGLRGRLKLGGLPEPAAEAGATEDRLQRVATVSHGFAQEIQALKAAGGGELDRARRRSHLG
jgi:hypothetical protein